MRNELRFNSRIIIQTHTIWRYSKLRSLQTQMDQLTYIFRWYKNMSWLSFCDNKEHLVLLLVIFYYISKNHINCTTTTKMHPITYLFITIEQLLCLKLRKHITCIMIHYLEKYCCEFVSCHAIMDIIFNVVENLGFFIIYNCNTSSPHRHFTLYWNHAQVCVVLFSVFCISLSFSIWYSI